MRKFLIGLFILFLVSCSVKYSFTGASISPQIKTFSVSYIENNAPNKKANLSDIFTEGLKDKFRSNAGLTLVPSNGDLTYEGSITEYSTTIQGVTANQVAANNRLTISVTIKFTNTLEPVKSFEKRFSGYRDFDASINLSSIEEAFVKEITDEIINEIFMESVANW